MKESLWILDVVDCFIETSRKLDFSYVDFQKFRGLFIRVEGVNLEFQTGTLVGIEKEIGKDSAEDQEEFLVGNQAFRILSVLQRNSKKLREEVDKGDISNTTIKFEN
jgi:hypothetical protein